MLVTWLVAVLQVVMAGVFFALGRVVMSRRPAGDGRFAGTAFGVWWYGLALLQAGGVLSTVIHNTSGWNFALYMAYFQSILLLIVVILYALTYYFIYIFTGRRRTWIPLAVAYGAYFVLLLYFVALGQPVGIDTTGSQPTVAYANDISDTTFATVVSILLIGPPLVGAMGYFSLFFKAPTRSQRFRIGTIGGAFIVWFGSSLVVSNFTDWSDTQSWQVVSTLISLVAGYMVYITFHPPGWIRRRFHVAGFGETASDGID